MSDECPRLSCRTQPYGWPDLPDPPAKEMIPSGMALPQWVLSEQGWKLVSVDRNYTVVADMAKTVPECD